MSEPVSAGGAGLVTAGKIGIAVARASLNPVKRAWEAKKRRSGLRALIEHSLMEVRKQTLEVDKTKLSSPVCLEPAVKLTERIMTVADDELTKGRRRRRVGQRTGYFNPTDRIAEVPKEEGEAILARWVLNGLQDALRNTRTEIDEPLLRQQTKQVVAQFYVEQSKAVKRGDKTASILVDSVTEANERYRKSQVLATAGALVGTSGAYATAAAIAVTNDRVVDSGDRPVLVVAGLAVTAAAGLLSRARHGKAQVTRDEREEAYVVAVDVTIKWLAELATQLLVITGLATPPYVQLASMIDDSGADRLGLLGHSGVETQQLIDDFATKMKQRLDNRIFPAARRSGDETLIGKLTILGDHLDRLVDHSAMFSYEDFSIAITESLNLLCDPPNAVTSNEAEVSTSV
jgi:hypothetical protein